jgi:hypothetical protein
MLTQMLEKKNTERKTPEDHLAHTGPRSETITKRLLGMVDVNVALVSKAGVFISHHSTPKRGSKSPNVSSGLSVTLTLGPHVFDRVSGNVTLDAHLLLSLEVTEIGNGGALPPQRGAVLPLRRLATEDACISEFDKLVSDEVDVVDVRGAPRGLALGGTSGKPVGAGIVVRDAGETGEWLVLGKEREDKCNVEGWMRRVEVLTELEVLETVRVGEEGARLGDEGGDAITSRQGHDELGEEESSEHEENSEELHVEHDWGCDLLFWGTGCE